MREPVRRFFVGDSTRAGRALCARRNIGLLHIVKNIDVSARGTLIVAAPIMSTAR